MTRHYAITLLKTTARYFMDVDETIVDHLIDRAGMQVQIGIERLAGLKQSAAWLSGRLRLAVHTGA